jgi:DNA-directed RNA polymerase specialized sigma24 family protein
VPRENLPHPSAPDGSTEPGPAGVYDELTAISADPGMRWHAQRLAHDLAEDLLQQTWYAVARALARGRPIDNLRGYFYRVMVRIAWRMREDVTRQGIPADDPVAAAGPRRGRELAAAPAEDEALIRLLNATRRELVHRRRAELRQVIPACSPDPDRYRDAIVDVTGLLLADDGPDERTEINDALLAAYPEWFAAPGASAAARYQRRCRGRADIGRVLRAVIGA